MSAPKRQREFAVEIVRRLQTAGHDAYWAGGCVRDILLGREPKDYDVATSALPDDVRDLFGRRKTFAVGASFGVILVRGPKGAGDVEVATFRTEGPYLDGRRPEHVAFSSAAEDAKRRDFTINGIFYDPVDPRVVDYVEGERDLAAGIVRAIGDPRARMNEDKLRLLRAVRFAATLEFELEESTAAAVREMAEQILIVSAERIAQELRRMLVDRHRQQAMAMAHNLSLLRHIIPELEPAGDRAVSGSAWNATLQMLNLLEQPSFELAAAALLHGIEPSNSHDAASSAGGGSDESATDECRGVADHAADVARTVCRRLRLSNKEIEHIGWLIAHQYEMHGAKEQPASKLKRLMSHELFTDLLELNRARLLATGGDLESVLYCEEYLRDTPDSEIDPPPLITGNDLIELGLASGPEFKHILTTVRDAQLNGEVSTREESLELVEKLVHEKRRD